MTDEPQVHNVGPFFNPVTNDIFARIGLLVLTFANFEMLLFSSFAVLLDDGVGEKSSAIFGQIDNFRYKFDMVMGVARETSPPTEISKTLLEIENDILQVNKFRNSLAHGGTRILGNEVWLITNANSIKRGEVKEILLTGEHLEKHQMLLIESALKLQKLLADRKMTGTKGLMRALRSKRGVPIEDQ
ncbi:MAG: hypothetical protein GC166_04845 [Alphaproteobacteria bacterium]|nr:hypothetical protein [Alphaproteobacteria bacterium]